MTTDAPAAAIREKALALGFDAMGFAPPELSDAAARNLAEYIDRGYHGDMGWLEAKAERRRAPNRLWPDVRSVVVLGVNYGPPSNPLDEVEPLRQAGRGNISVYARNDDYHEILKKRLKALGRWMCAEFSCDARVFVDTAPVMEKPLAQIAGLGWQGKHTNLVSRQFGSWLFLGEVYTTLDLGPTASESDHCGSCRKCLAICPTDAFPAPYQLDARRCISYLTIEHKGHIPRDLRRPIGTRIYGCDDCLAVCPWNKFARATTEPAFHTRKGLEAPLLAELARLDDAAFRATFSKSPVKRIGRDRFVRNVLVAIGNTGNPELSPAAEDLLADPSPLVRAMAVWALGQLLEPTPFRRLRGQYEPDERDPSVRREWELA